MTAAIDGTYSDAFFGTSESKKGYNKRLRAVVQSTMSEFAEQMGREGHAIHIVDSKSARSTSTKGGPQSITRDKYLDSVTIRMRRNRGRELPGLFNPSIIGDLFYEQSRPWEQILRDTQEKLLSAAKTTVNMVLDQAADKVTKDGILRYIIGPNVEPICEKLNQKVEEVLTPHQKGHPLTFNHYFTDNLQKKRQEELRKVTSDKIRAFFNTDPNSATGGWV